MPAQYTEITFEEMKTFLEDKGFNYNFATNAYEHIFKKQAIHTDETHHLKDLYTLQVYTSVSFYNNKSRDAGKDAIHIIIYNDKGFTAGDGRVNRTQGWKENLEKRLNNWQGLVKWCIQCGHPLRLRTGKYGKFYGCSTFPNCGYTEKVKD